MMSFEFTVLTSKTNNFAVPFAFIFFCEDCPLFYNVSEDCSGFSHMHYSRYFEINSVS